MAEDEFRRVDLSNDEPQERALRRVADAAHRLNEAVQRAVKENLPVELIRVSRHHDGQGNWGDQIVPMIRGERRAEPSALE